MQKTKKAQLVEGSIASTLTRLTIPMIFGVFAMVAFNLIDTFFVGQLGLIELAAMGYTFPVVLIISSIAMGLGMGASAVISRAIGNGDQQEVQRLTTDSLVLSVSIVALALIAGMMTIEPVFRLLGADEATLPLIRSYMQIWYPGIIFVVIPMVGNSAIRATGDTKTPSIIMLVAVAGNIILDPLLIFGIGPFPRMELAGAALATVISRAITLIVSLWVLYFREQMITFSRPKLSIMLDSWTRILYIGLPAAGTNIIMPLGTGVLTNLVSAYGPAAVGAFAVATRIDALALTVVFALSSVIAPFVGQNMGAGKIDRVKTGVWQSQIFSLGWGIGVAVLLAIFARPVAEVFNDDPLVIENIVLYLWLAPIGYGMAGVLRLSNSVLNVMGRPLHASILMIIQMFALFVPLAYLGSSFFGLAGIFGAAALANGLGGLFAYLWLRRDINEEEASQLGTFKQAAVVGD